MRQQVTEKIKKCDVCIKYDWSYHTEKKLITMDTSDFQRHPIDMVGLDLFGHRKWFVLFMADKYSGYCLYKEWKKWPTSKQVTEQFADWCLEFRFLSTVRLDFSPQFRSNFGTFCSNTKSSEEILDRSQMDDTKTKPIVSDEIYSAFNHQSNILAKWILGLLKLLF